MANDGPGPLLRRVLHAPVLLYRLRLGALLGSRFLRLTHLGRNSGRRYETVLEVVGRLPTTTEYVVMAGLGRRADWLRNVLAGGAQEVAVGRDRFRPTARVLDDDEAVGVLADYEQRHRLLAPVVRRVLSRPSGGGTPGPATGELPLVAFGPAGAEPLP